MILDACNSSKKSEVAIYSAKQNYGLFYLQAMVPKERKELLGFMESLPVCKEITCTDKAYYVVESWLDEYDQCYLCSLHFSLLVELYMRSM